jgi:formylglycine-generating enzyme required for sulfatase activity
MSACLRVGTVAVALEMLGCVGDRDTSSAPPTSDPITAAPAQPGADRRDRPLGSGSLSRMSTVNHAAVIALVLALTDIGCAKEPEPVVSATAPVAESTDRSETSSQVDVDTPEISPEPPEPPATFGPWPCDGPCPTGMVLIEGGRFTERQRKRLTKLFAEYPNPDFEPAIEPFCLALYETTHGDFWECAKAEHCIVGERLDVNYQTLPECRSKDAPCSPEVAVTPLAGIRDRVAREYCHARGGRLPTVPEWYWAALGGTEDRHYPWGNSPPSEDRLNVCDLRCLEYNCDYGEGKIDKTCAKKEYPPALSGDDGYLFQAPVGSYPAGVGRWGHFDLLGNVAEYASFISEGGPVALCGGSSVSLKNQSLDLHGNVCPSARSTFDSSGVRCAARPLTASSRK